MKRESKGRKTLPSRYVYDLYEIFPSLDNIGSSKKIILPYLEVDKFNRHDLNRPYEVLPVKLVKNKNLRKIDVSSTQSFVLPIALLDKSGFDDKPKLISLSYDNQKVEINLRFKNRFHYLPIKVEKKINQILIQSNHSLLAIGNPIYNQEKTVSNSSRLIVHICVDALSKVLLDSCKSESMPATKSFFSDGITFENAYAQGDWTLSSIAGVFTGKYTKDHLIYHPRRDDKLVDQTLAEILNNQGYLTTFISAVPKLSPINGFDKGFNRFLCSPFQDATYIINQVKEQLDAFEGNQYLFVGLFDVHEANTLQPLSSQVTNLLNDFNYKEINRSKSLSILYDRERAAMYLNTLKHLDNKLEALYARIKQYDENAVVILHSDHGVDFITQNTQRLSNEREKVALMIRGGNLEYCKDFSIKEIRDIPNMVLNASGVKKMKDIVPSEFAKTESLYPNQEYELAVRDDKYTLFFQVPWRDIKNRNISNFQYRSSLHKIDNESEQVKDSAHHAMMLRVAKDHYFELINNLVQYDLR